MINVNSSSIQRQQFSIDPLSSPEAGDLEVVVDGGFQTSLHLRRHLDIGGFGERRDIGALFGFCFSGMFLSLGVVANAKFFDQHIGRAGGSAISAISFIAMAIIAVLTITCYFKHEPVEEVSNNRIPFSQADCEARDRAYLEVKGYEVTFLKAMIDSYVEQKAKTAMQHMQKWPQTEDACKKHLCQYLEQKLDALIQSPKGTESVIRSTQVTDPTKELYYWDDFVRHSMDSLLNIKKVPEEAYPAAKAIWDYNGE